LKSRSGHHQPPTFIRFHGEDAKRILSASSDRSLRSFSTLRHEQNFEFSQGSLEKKANKYDVSIDELKVSQVLQIASCKLMVYDLVTFGSSLNLSHHERK
jgi:U3 small nucleolar RNA-associated protein 21